MKFLGVWAACGIAAVGFLTFQMLHSKSAFEQFVERLSGPAEVAVLEAYRECITAGRHLRVDCIKASIEMGSLRNVPSERSLQIVDQWVAHATQS